MQELDLSIELLKEIFEKHVTYDEALKEKFQPNEDLRPLRPAVAALVATALRHDILFSYLLSGEVSKSYDTYLPAAILLGNAYFCKKVPLETLAAAVKVILGESLYSSVEPLFSLGAEKQEEDSNESQKEGERAHRGPKYIPDSVKPGSEEYFSIRYNVPLWAVKTIRHFGYKNLRDSLWHSLRYRTETVRANYHFLPKTKIEANSNFVPTDVEAIYQFQAKASRRPLRRDPWYIRNWIFPEKPGIKYLFDLYKVEEPKEVFFYGNEDQAMKELLASYGNSVGLNLGVSNSVDAHLSVTRMIREGNLHNVNFFSAAPDGLEAYITHPQDLVIALPDSTHFDVMHESPDFFVHFDPSRDLDALIKSQRKTLEGLAPYVAENGLLIYLVLTMNKNEGYYPVSDFLTAHPEFKLVEERQMFPFESLNTAMYYAVLSKSLDLAKATPPLAEIVPSENLEATVAASPSDSVSAANPQPIPEPTSENVSENISPAPEPAPEPVSEPAPEPVSEPAPEPVSEPVSEPAPEPVSEPVSEPAASESPSTLSGEGVESKNAAVEE